MKKTLKNTDKVMVSGRVPLYVKEYCETKNITISQLLMQGFDSFRNTDKDHALIRLDYHEKRVLHWRSIVLQHDEECNTKHHICNTLRNEFKKHGRGHKDTKREDMSWCDAKADQLINEGIIINGKELYDICTKDMEEG